MSGSTRVRHAFIVRILQTQAYNIRVCGEKLRSVTMRRWRKCFPYLSAEAMCKRRNRALNDEPSIVVADHIAQTTDYSIRAAAIVSLQRGPLTITISRPSGAQCQRRTSTDHRNAA